MKKIIYPFLAFSLVMTLLLGYNELINNKGKVLSSQTSTLQEQNKELTPAELTSQYQNSAKSIFNVLNALIKQINNNNALTERLAVLSDLKDTTLGLRVPTQYKDLHLGLMSTIDQLQKLLLAKQEEIMNTELNKINYNFDFSFVKTGLDKISKENPWII